MKDIMTKCSKELNIDDPTDFEVLKVMKELDANGEGDGELELEEF